MILICIIPPPSPSTLEWSDAGCCRSDWSGLFCFVINPCVVSHQSWFWSFFLFHKFSNFTPPPPISIFPLQLIKILPIFSHVHPNNAFNLHPIIKLMFTQCLCSNYFFEPKWSPTHPFFYTVDDTQLTILPNPLSPDIPIFPVFT